MYVLRILNSDTPLSSSLNQNPVTRLNLTGCPNAPDFKIYDSSVSKCKGCFNLALLNMLSYIVKNEVIWNKFDLFYNV